MLNIHTHYGDLQRQACDDVHATI